MKFVIEIKRENVYRVLAVFATTDPSSLKVTDGTIGQVEDFLRQALANRLIAFETARAAEQHAASIEGGEL